MKKVILIGVVMAVAAAGQAQDCESYVPGKCAQLSVTNGTACNPPVFIPPSGQPEWTVRMQVEIWQQLLGSSRLFARVWAEDTTFAYIPVWDGYVLLGNGPYGFRLFPAGQYIVRMRGWNPIGFGEWSDPVYFTVSV